MRKEVKKVDVMDYVGEAKVGDVIVIVGKQADSRKYDVVVGKVVEVDDLDAIVEIVDVIKDSEYEGVKIEKGDEFELQASWLYGFVIECKDENEARKIAKEIAKEVE